MKKIIKHIFLILFLLLGFLNVNAKDISSSFTIIKAQTCSDANCTIEYNADTSKESAISFLIRIEYKYLGEAIENNDTVSFPIANEITSNTTVQFSGSFVWSDIFDNSGHKIGQWRITGEKQAKKVEIQFSNYAVGKTSLEGILVTTKNIHEAYHTFIDRYIPLTVANKTLTLNIKKRNVAEVNGSYYGITTSSTTNNFNWWVADSSTGIVRELFRDDEYTELTDDVKCKKLYYESMVPEGLRIVNFNTELLLYGPTNIELPRAGKISALYQNIVSRFTKVTQNDNETYNDFKNRLNPLEYGYYKDQNNNQLIVINYGDYPSSDLTYHGVLGSEPGTYARNKNPYTITPEIETILNEKYGSTNMIGGRVAQWRSSFSLEYPQVYVDTPISQTSTWTCIDINNNEQIKQVSGNVNLVVPSSIAIVRGQAKLIVLDKNSKLPLKNISMTLQKKEGSNWIDISTKQTDDSGLIENNSLEDGEYRYIQNNYLDHYKTNSYQLYSDSDNNLPISSFTLNSDGNISYATNERESFIITYKHGNHGNFSDQIYTALYGDTTPIYTETTDSNGWNFVKWEPTIALNVTSDATYTAIWEKYVTLTKHYYLKNSTTKIKDDEIISVKVGESYHTEKTDVPNKYVFVSKIGDEEGLTPDNNIEISYYYDLKPSTVTIKYLEDGTNTELAPTITRNLKYDDSYETTSSDLIPKNYNLIRTTGELNGIVSSDNIVVIYYYQKKPSNITDNIIKTGTEEIDNKNDEVSYKIVYSLQLDDYIGKGTVTITDYLPYDIDINNSNLDSGTYNNKTITWIENLNNINTYDNNNTFNITKNIRIKYTNINSKERTMTNTAKALLELDNNGKQIETIFNTNLSIKGKISIQYIDDEGNNLQKPIIYNDLVGKTVSSQEQTFEGYYLVEKPNTEVYEITDEEQTIKYLYKRYVYNISTTSSKGGTIKGNEAVKHGENSTPNNIVIEADSGYCINTIKVNNKNIKVTSCEKQILDNFKNITENKLIEVTFRLKNPKTTTTIKTILAIISIIIITILIKYKTTYKQSTIFDNNK